MTLIALATGGDVMAAQPGVETFSPWMWFGLQSAIAVAVRDLIGGGINMAIPGLVVAVAAGAIGVVDAGGAGLVLERWTWPSLTALTLAFGFRCFLIAAYWLLLSAYRKTAVASSVASVAPFLYMSTLRASLTGWLMFDTLLDPVPLCGMALTVATEALAVAFERWPRRSAVSDIRRMIERAGQNKILLGSTNRALRSPPIDRSWRDQGSTSIRL